MIRNAWVTVTSVAMPSPMPAPVSATTWRRWVGARGYTVYGAARRVEKIEELASEGVKASAWTLPMKHPWEAAADY